MLSRNLWLVFFLPALLLGCGAREPAGPEQPAATLTLWHIFNYEGPREVVAEAVARFEAAHPNVRVQVQPIANDAYKAKLEIEMESGTPPDVFFTWGGGKLASKARAGLVVDLTDAMAEEGWRERFLPAALDLCSADGRIYAAPLDLACVPLWYNEALFRKYGLTPPRGYADLLALCKTLREKGVIPLALGNRQQWPGAFYFIYLASRLGGSRLFFDALARKEGRRFDDEVFVEAGRRVQELVAVKAFSDGFNGIEDSRARAQFLNGEAAMYLMGTWLVARAKKEKPDLLPHLKCVPFPAVAGGKGSPATVVGGVNAAFAVSARCKRPDLAVELLRYLTAPEVGEAWVGTGRIPAVKVSRAALDRLPAATKAALALLERAPILQPYYDQYMPDRLAEEHKKTTQGLFNGTLTPEAAARRVEKAAARLLKP